MITDYSSPSWFNHLMESINKNIPDASYHFSFKTTAEIKKTFSLPPTFLKKINGFSNIIAIYMDAGCYKKERLLYYHTYLTYMRISPLDYAGRLICKMKLISNENCFSNAAEQDMGLIMGIIQRLGHQKRYDINFVDEKLYFDLHTGFSYHKEMELIHLILLNTSQHQ
ncbi:hypothetical protein [Pedobacter nototheniae]|uniref:hypothetical protein n=1 Tax=Pedobacter nototheniae TaxID=2488994 RepID=UPI00292E1FE2|nr:hypothetical protein [Pedobacter nototheniae]